MPCTLAAWFLGAPCQPLALLFLAGSVACLIIPLCVGSPQLQEDVGVGRTENQGYRSWGLTMAGEPLIMLGEDKMHERPF